MKKILGLDLGTTSIGWALVNEAENESEKSEILKLGVRVIPLSTDEEADFKKGKAVSINADRTLKRGARRNLDRYQLRRNNLIEVLKENNLISENFIYSEEGEKTTFSTYQIRAKAAKQKVTKEEFARTLLTINKKRGYKSSRKTKSEDDGTAVDGMSVAKKLYDNDLTPGQFVYERLKKGKKNIPDFYRSDLKAEFNKIWNFQKQFYPEILTDDFREKITGKTKKITNAIFLSTYKLYYADNKKTKENPDPKLTAYKWRTQALTEKVEKEIFAYIIIELNNQINQSSGYLGAISDRSKELYFNKQTVGEYLYSQIEKNAHTRLKNQVFYRQDYLDEFETIWETQKQYHSELTEELKKEIRDVVIFYQRPLKSQKALLSLCEFENFKTEIIDKETGEIKIKTVGQRVIPNSSPLFQEFKIWTILNNIEIKNKIDRKKRFLELEEKEILFKELTIAEKLKADEALKILTNGPNNFEINYKEIEGNRTVYAFIKIFDEIFKIEEIDNKYKKASTAEEKIKFIKKFMSGAGIDTRLLDFNSDLDNEDYNKQPILQLWHLLYSYEGDKSPTGNNNLIQKLNEKFGIPTEYAKYFVNTKLSDNYGSLSSRAIRKILPHLKAGNKYDLACSHAGYNHSHSKTKLYIEKKVLKDYLEILPKNSLRNPVVEKILNQMINVINAIIKDEKLGKPDEIRVELARELKYSAKERADMTKNINAATIKHERIRKILSEEFGVPKVTKNDIIRYKLWQELESTGYKTIYTNTSIPKEKLFSKEVDIEHIVPKARIFDDSFSNKTLAIRSINLEKGDDTAYDFLKKKLSSIKFEQFLARAQSLYKNGKISKSKYIKLLKKNTEIDDGFIERDLRNSQYIAKKAKQMLEEVVKTVNTTTGKITDRLRTDWQLINVMKELNFPKYEKAGLIETIEGKNGNAEYRIKDWTKRNDHRHHAMDALTVAFTKSAFVQFLNNMNARKDEKHEKYHSVYGIEQKYLHRKNGSLVFNPPMPIRKFRSEAKKHLENILVSFKAKNKVTTKNKNKIKGKQTPQIVGTPRGQLHKETVYGKIKQYKTKEEKINASFDKEKIALVANFKHKELLLKRLEEFENDPKKAFTGKNTLSKKPIYLDEKQEHTLPEKVKLVWLEEQYTIRKDISQNLKIDKVVDVKIRDILQKRLEEFNNKPKEAFANLDESPIWLNKEKGIAIKRVTITGVSNAIPLHYKKNHNGEFILDENNEKIPVDFVSTGNNHHVAIYRDEKGNLQEEIVSFFDAVKLRNHGLPVINKTLNQDKGWKFLFTMKQNEYFVFPNETTGFNPNEINLLDEKNAKVISPNLFRVATLSKVDYRNNSIRDYVFRHHLETTTDKNIKLRNVTFIPVKSLPRLEGIVKVRINHLGKIVHVGEY